MAGMERFTQRARRVLSLAHQEAERTRNKSIGTEHLLVGLLGEEGGVAGRVLRELGITTERVRETIRRVTSASADFDPNRVELAVDTQRTLEYAVDEARRLGHHSIGTEHMLLGLARFDNTGMEVLRRLGVTPEQVRRQTRRVLNESAAHRETKPSESSTSKKANQVLLAYGRDPEAGQMVASYIESLGLQVVKSGRHSDRQFDAFAAELVFMVALLTADDVVVSQSQTQIRQFHASQNVIYELGFFRGKLGHNRVCVLFKSDPEMNLELPTEPHRVVYIPLDSTGTWKLTLSERMQKVGIIVNSGKIE